MQMSKVKRRQIAPVIQNSLLWSTKSVQAPYQGGLKSLNTTSNVRITLDSNCKLYLYSNNDIYFKQIIKE